MFFRYKQFLSEFHCEWKQKTKPVMKIGVIGSGVVGVTTALELQKEYPNALISIVADKFYKDTLSHVAAGFFRPSDAFAGPTEDITKKWVVDSFQHWDDIRKTAEASKAGVTELSGYIFSSISESITRNPLIEDVLPVYRRATEEELRICPGNWKYGSFFSSVLTECALYLPWATQKFLRSGGMVLNKKVNSFNDIYGDYDVVINCTGMNAKQLCNDRKLTPVRGQVLKVDAPWIKNVFYADYDTYIIPGFSSVTCGGCRNFESWNTNVSPHDTASIKERCEALIPGLKTAPVKEIKVGLRPHRDPCRVEIEFVDIPNRGIMRIVHQYGHGGYGVGCAPGTAKYAVKLVRDIWTGYSKF